MIKWNKLKNLKKQRENHYHLEAIIDKWRPKEGNCELKLQRKMFLLRLRLRLRDEDLKFEESGLKWIFWCMIARHTILCLFE